MGDRRRFLRTAGGALLGALAPAARPRETPMSDTLRLFLCGDVMTGRGLDQVLPHPVDPRLHEPYMGSALGYVALAEEANGPIRRPVNFAYPWGDALGELAAAAPDLRIANLETAVTTRPDWLPKGINYRMHPDNVPVLTAAGLDACVLANNHVLDWGEAGLLQTLDTLHGAGLATAGAGRDLAQASAPAVLEVPGKGRVLVLAYGHPSSGVPQAWAAGPQRPGVSLLDDLSPSTADTIAAQVQAARRPGDRVVVSLHWGGNWGYAVPDEQRAFAHALVERAGADVVHGHSSHHAKGVEVYRGRPIVYGCGDFLNDYEGIGGYETYRGDLPVMVFVDLDANSGRLRRLFLRPLRIRRLRLQRASAAEARWLRDTLDREGRALGTRVALTRDGSLDVRWQE
jgi:poly-gamma-glutamate capsule biosynthesis protein CapA/YwtB (metallophosphatase superfamily)